MPEKTIEMRCPHCDKRIGTKNNPFQFESVTFFINSKKKGRDIFPIFCGNCGKILGIV